MTAFVLGTAQFGAGYGVTNTVGRLTDDTVAGLVSRATDRGVRLFDTAAGYGDAEDRLGTALGSAAEAGVVTKFALPADGEPVTADGLFDDSRRRLRGARVHGVLLHRVADLRDPRFAEALALLRAARAEGTVARIGVSIYDDEDLALAVEAFPDLDLIQIPGSVVDRRLLDAPGLAALHADGVEVHVRSVFLQGLLLAHPDRLDARFSPLLPHVARLRALAEEAGITVAELLVQQVRDHPVADALVVGATSIDELDEVLDAFAGKQRDRIDLPELPVDVVDPRRW